jgi:2-dehydropantoate 2-reductase
VDANPAKVEAGQRRGVRVDARPPLRADFVHFTAWRPDPAALVLLCTKCYDNAAVLTKLPPGAHLLPIQNGFDPQLDASGHAVEGIASFVSECAGDEPHTRITRRGDLHLGYRGRPALPAPPTSASGGREPPEARQPEMIVGPSGAFSRIPIRVASGGSRPPLAEELRAAGLFRVRHVPDIGPLKHTKLMYNAAISPLAAAAGLDNGALLSLPQVRRLFFALLQENHSILRSAGIELGRVGPFRPQTVAWILRRRWLAGLMARFFEPSLRGTYCSMAGEIQKGRTELDNYNGHLIRLADTTGAPCPLNRAVYDLVVKMTAARELPHRVVLDELMSAPRGAVAVTS